MKVKSQIEQQESNSAGANLLHDISNDCCILDTPSIISDLQSDVRELSHGKRNENAETLEEMANSSLTKATKSNDFNSLTVDVCEKPKQESQLHEVTNLEENIKAIDNLLEMELVVNIEKKSSIKQIIIQETDASRLIDDSTCVHQERPIGRNTSNIYLSSFKYVSVIILLHL